MVQSGNAGASLLFKCVKQVVERSFAWAARFRRLARDYERLAQTLAAYHYVAFACLMLPNALTAVANAQVHNRL